MRNAIAPFEPPTLASTVAFVVIVIFVCAALLAAVDHAYRDTTARIRHRVTAATAAVVAVCMAVTTFLAHAGIFYDLALRGQMLAYVIIANGTGVVLALSPLGKRIAVAAPLWALIGFHAFRLPLELVLHAWYKQGCVPVQMTYEGDNWDIITGILALVAGAALALAPLSKRTHLAVAWGTNIVGFALLIRVMSIALRSIPGPSRSPTYEAPLLLPLYAPYTWILPICVAGALTGHIIVFRNLLASRSQATMPLG